MYKNTYENGSIATCWTDALPLCAALITVHKTEQKGSVRMTLQVNPVV